MTLSQIKSRYAGKCAKCERELKEGWTVMYDRDEKKIYCMPCGKAIESGETAEATTEVTMIRIPSRFVDVCSQCGGVIDIGEEHYYQPDKNEVYCLGCGELVKEMSKPETKATAELKMLMNTLEVLISEVSGQTKLNSDLLAILGDNISKLSKRFEAVETNLIVVAAKQTRDVAPKEQKKEAVETTGGQQVGK